MTENTGPDVAETGSSPTYTIIHQVKCPGSSPAHSCHPAIASFLDVPRLFLGDNKASPLRGRHSGEHTKLKTKLDPDISFVIHRTYNCLEYHASVFAALEEAPSGVSVLAEDARHAVTELEHMEIVSNHLSDAIEEVKDRDSYDVGEFQHTSLLLGWGREQSLIAPYLHFYYARDLFAKHECRLQSQKEHINLLLGYLSDEFGREFKEAEDLFSKGLVTRKHFHKLFGPREVLATINRAGHQIAMVSRYPPLPGSDPMRVECEIMDFNGKLVKYKRIVSIPWPKNLSESDTASFGSLSAFPVRFDGQLKRRLRKRGKLFWKLRKRKLIQYTAPDELFEYQMKNGRYMVDVETYHRSCGESRPEDPNMDEFVEQLNIMDFSEFTAPPPEEFVLLMPPTIYGFGFHDKQWRRLEVRFATEIIWNDRAFEMLVLPQKEKDLLNASVLKSKASDELKIFSGRGPGVVILLHGGPGIGKTFAAVALAELSRRPLYRLTFSDIGTSVREVESNLNQAFYLGGIWDAIMLLDECDIYLETRRQSDLSRNAIVSIILHVLDYHQGITILTSRGLDLDAALQPRVHEFYGNLPKYAILSHTWGSEEVTFQDWADSSSIPHESGYTKIIEACKQAKGDGYLYVWVDTNCIDKTSSAELTEAINSMFTWYNRAGICYAYLSDVPTFKPISFAKGFRRSRWFKRGWTLQELLAPEEVVFYAADWSRIGTKATLVREIAEATGINIKYLCPEKRAVAATRDGWTKSLHITCHEASVAERMSWLARRETTRIEDMAYCMLGIFGISMPLLYGEGQGAFLRLQEEILKSSDDHSLFCWSWTMDEGQSSLLSLRPHSFLEATHYRRSRSNAQPSPYSMTNAGLSIRLRVIRCWSSHIAILNVQIPDTNEYVGIP
ncbi:hypothetical protein KAF25_008668, partial [Fusarium avenaceum]